MNFKQSLFIATIVTAQVHAQDLRTAVDQSLKLTSAPLVVGDVAPCLTIPTVSPRTPSDPESQALARKKWIAGAPNCDVPGAKEPKYDLLRVNANYFVIRQNKCITFEAPFLYLTIGETGAFLHDTGATSSPDDFPLRQLIDQILGEKEREVGHSIHLTVGHGHSHGDHTAGDGQFADRPNTTVVGLSPQDVAQAYGIPNWPNGTGTLDLGGRRLTVIPIPGHEPSSVAFYDSATGDMFTGDSLYPGNIFLDEASWPEFQASIGRLHEFTRTHPVRNFLGSHVEMSNHPGVDYSYGTTYQPEEHRLPLYQRQLDELYEQTRGTAHVIRDADFQIPL